MKKIFVLFIAVIAMTARSNLIASAFDYENFAYEFTDNKIIITNYTGTTEGTIIVPNEIDEKEVSEIGEKAFYGLLNGDSTVVISDNICKINDYAFTGLIGIGMDSIYIPKSVEYIGKYSIGYTFYPYSNTQNECVVEQYKAYPVKIYGYVDTTAEIYANKNGFTFIALDEQITTTIPVTTTTETVATTTTTESTTLENTATTTTSTSNITEVTATNSTSEIETTTVLTDNVTEVTATNSTSETDTTTAESENVTEITDTISTSETTTTTIVATNYKNITVEDFINWAKNDYRSKTGITPANSVLSETPDGYYEISLVDDTGNVLDIYTVDPVTATGTNQNKEEVNLPQTGYSKWYQVIAGLAVCMTGIGGAMVIGSGKLKKKRK